MTNNADQEFNDFLNSLRDMSRSESEKGALFVKVIVSYLKNDNLYKDRFKNVWPWDKWPHRKETDYGVDIVAEEAVVDGGGG